MQPLGYIVIQHSVRLDRPVIAYRRWNDRIENIYREAILGERGNSTLLLTEYPSCLALLKHYKTLMFMAKEARKPMFHLKPADGAIGSHIQAVQSAYGDFQQLAQKIAALVQIPIAKSG
jgi:chromosome partitioning protein